MAEEISTFIDPHDFFPKESSPQLTSPASISNSHSKEKKVRRPPNSYIIFCMKQRQIIHKENPTLSNKEITHRLGSMWAVMTDEEKQQYIDEANSCAVEFKNQHPEYHYEKCKKKKLIQQLRMEAGIEAPQQIQQQQQQMQQMQQQQILLHKGNFTTNSVDPSTFNDPCRCLIYLGTQVLLQYIQQQNNENKNYIKNNHNINKNNVHDKNNKIDDDNINNNNENDNNDNTDSNNNVNNNEKTKLS